METNNKTKTIPMSAFKEAALIYFKSQPDEIEIRMITESKEAFIIHKGEGYKISTREALREEVAIQLTDKRAALDIDLGCWIQTTKHTVKMNRILGTLVRTIEDTEDAKKLLIAVGLGSYTDNPDEAFWEILARIDSGGDVLGKVIVTTVQVYSGSGLIDGPIHPKFRQGFYACFQYAEDSFSEQRTIRLNQEVGRALSGSFRFPSQTIRLAEGLLSLYPFRGKRVIHVSPFAHNADMLPRFGC